MVASQGDEIGVIHRKNLGKYHVRVIFEAVHLKLHPSSKLYRRLKRNHIFTMVVRAIRKPTTGQVSLHVYFPFQLANH